MRTARAPWLSQRGRRDSARALAVMAAPCRKRWHGDQAGRPRPIGADSRADDLVAGVWDTREMAITGVHAILYTRDAEADRAWLADVLELQSVDAGGGWLIFALPPAELAAHPASGEGGDVALYLMCDDIETTVQELSEKGVAFDGP